jgi:hypothetical protein
MDPIHTWCGENLRNNFDALPRARPVAEDILLALVEVRDLSALHVHGEGSLFVVGITASPLPGSLRQLRVATGPYAQAQSHRGLRVVQGIVGILGQQCPHKLSIDVPLKHILCPDGGIVMVVILHAVGDGVVDGVVKIRKAFAEVVRLRMSVVAAKILPIDLVQVVAEPHHGRDDASALGHLQPDLGAAEEEVELGSDSWAVALLVDGEDGAFVGGVGDGSGGRLPRLGGGRHVENEVVVHAERRIRRTCLVHRVAVRRDLCEGGRDRRQQPEGRVEESPRQHTESNLMRGFRGESVVERLPSRSKLQQTWSGQDKERWFVLEASHLAETGLKKEIRRVSQKRRQKIGTKSTARESRSSKRGNEGRDEERAPRSPRHNKERVA